MNIELDRDNFEGVNYRIANNWVHSVPLEEFKNKPINYLEIGTFYGANLFTVADSYGSHEYSKLYCIDPWEEYEDYTEYKNEQKSIFETFKRNLEKRKDKDKVVVKRGYSNEEILKFPDEFFDIIYVDGNHESEYVLEDGVLAFRKLKVGGYLIFDDYGWKDKNDYSTVGINCFHRAYSKRLEYLETREMQVFFRKRR